MPIYTIIVLANSAEAARDLLHGCDLPGFIEYVEELEEDGMFHFRHTALAPITLEDLQRRAGPGRITHVVADDNQNDALHAGENPVDPNA